MHTVFALLDDASTEGPAAPRSRLYTGHVGTLACHDGAGWTSLLDQLQQALAQGLYAVPLLSYELGAHLLDLPVRADAATLAQVLLFSHCQHLTSAAALDWVTAQAGDTSAAGVANLHANIDQHQFSDAIDRIRAYIAAGDTYQVNYTYRLRFDAYGTPCALYARLRARQPVPYGALIALPDGSAVLSFSPELFVRHADGVLRTRPMKGTAPASGDAATDAARAADLAHDPKNRAENLMIVDLLRNDLGRVAATGSVSVPDLFQVNRFGAVLQMTSTIEARLRPDVSLPALFAALYPCGSITGAPKRRTMEIIDELEPAPRGLYTGAIGWFDPPAPGQAFGNFCLSVPIRTLLLGPGTGLRQGELGVGAGIVFDSDAEAEFAECQLKARFLSELPAPFSLFETLPASHAGVPRLAAHLARLGASAAYFGLPFDSAATGARVLACCEALKLDDGVVRLRISLQAGQIPELSTHPLPPLPGQEVKAAQPIPSAQHTPSAQDPLALSLPTVGVLLASTRTQSDDVFLRHKTSLRSRYDAAWREAEAQGAFDALFFNERDELTEGGRSNVFVRIDGQWVTPPLHCGVLPGVMRAALLADTAWQAREAVITRAMLGQASQIVLCNALRGPMLARLAA